VTVQPTGTPPTVQCPTNRSGSPNLREIIDIIDNMIKNCDNDPLTSPADILNAGDVHGLV